ncbi:hypothetical protein SIO17_07435 [Pseudoalteromonas piscicida]|uniref:ATPase n=1 Tax=Pseudoalteromonas piscicida TaxID=43662 RepID=A0ABM6NDU6_PSEO7|nr:hypothetical protein [Pseudoalteromonas piscicida]ATD06867.1 hypothetical protein PPIS_a1789 [Pseudoalteromonas piscicida]WPU33551.1 hypothetical protein SIO17_07435 [Pseudoalteromonas piscicida]
MNRLEKIYDSWMLEADDESGRLFYEPPWLKRVKDGKAIFLIGRKGTGKTAIVEHIKSLKINSCSKHLTFSDYPIENLRGYSDINAPSGFQYTLLWELLIYSSLCKLLLKNSNLDSKVRKQLNDICPQETEPLYEQIQSVIRKGFSATLPTGFGSIGGSKSEERNFAGKDIRLVRDFLKSTFYREAGKDMSYYVLFDSLDIGFNNISPDISDEDNRTYFSMLACLFRVAKSVKSESERQGLKAYPMVFILKEIYSQVRDNDKNKWRDVSIELEWRVDTLQEMLAHRINKTLDISGECSFSESWFSIFKNESIETGKNYNGTVTKSTIWDFITTRSYRRPRDYVVFIKECCKVEVEKGNNKISANTVANTAKKYSEIFIDELQDELGQKIPGLKKVLSIFSELGRKTFHCEDFISIYEYRVETGKISKSECHYDSDELIDVFFENSIIGNSGRGEKKRKFRFDSEFNSLNREELICVHMGLEEKLLETNSGKRSRSQIELDLIPNLISDIKIYLDEHVEDSRVHEKFSLLSKTLAIHIDDSVVHKEYFYIRKSLNGLDLLVKNNVTDRAEKKRLMEAIRCAHGYELNYK